MADQKVDLVFHENVARQFFGTVPDTVDGVIKHLEKLVCEVEDALVSITFRKRNVTAEPHYTTISTEQDSSTYKTADSKMEKNSQPLPKVVNRGYTSPNNKMLPRTSSSRFRKKPDIGGLIDRWIEIVFGGLREDLRSYTLNIRMAINYQSGLISNLLLHFAYSRSFLEKFLKVYKDFYDGLAVELQTLYEALGDAVLLEESLEQADGKKCETYASPSFTELDYLRQDVLYDTSRTQHWDPRWLSELYLDARGIVSPAHLDSILDLLISDDDYDSIYNGDNFMFNRLNRISNSTSGEILNFLSTVYQTFDGILSTPALLLEQRSVKRTGMTYAEVVQEGNIDVIQWMNHTSTRLRRLTAIFLMIKRRVDFRYDIIDLLEEFQDE